MKCKLALENYEMGVKMTGTVAYPVLLGVIMILLNYFSYPIIHHVLNIYCILHKRCYWYKEE
jgi:hypothetical protein